MGQAAREERIIGKSAALIVENEGQAAVEESFRTSMAAVPSYDATAVARTLAEDFERHEPPLVLRADRAKHARRTAGLRGPWSLPDPDAARVRTPSLLLRAARAPECGASGVDGGCGAPLGSRSRSRSGVYGQKAEPAKAEGNARMGGGERLGRPTLQENRQDLQDEVADRTARPLRKKEARGWAAGLAARLAIERALSDRRYLRPELGGRCCRNGSKGWVHPIQHATGEARDDELYTDGVAREAAPSERTWAAALYCLMPTNAFVFA